MRTPRFVKYLIRGVFLASLLSSFSVPALAQTLTSDNDTGYPENAIVQGTKIESVQVNNGNLHVEIPIYSAPGRGLDTAFSFVLDTKGWSFRTQCAQGVCTDHPFPAPNSNVTLTVHGPFDYDIAKSTTAVSCSGAFIYELLSNVVLAEPNGTKHHFVPDPVRSAPTKHICDQTNSTYSSTLYADDASGWVVNVNPSDNFTTITVISKGGANAYGSVAGKVTDRNGNFINPVSPTTGTDTLGRNVNRDGSYLDSSGTLRSVSITNTTVPLQLSSLCVFSTADNCTVNLFSMSAPSSVTLPNGMTYSFTYAQDGGAEPLSMTLPTGGQINWTWGLWDAAGRRVASRTVQSNGVTGAWQYVHSYGPSIATTIKVTDPANNDTLYTCKDAHPLPCLFSKVQRFAGSVSANQILQTLTTDYITYPFPTTYASSPQQIQAPIRDTTTWNTTNQVKKRETDWDNFAVAGGTATWGNPIELREYDLGNGAPGPLLKRTHYNYLHLLNSTYLNKNIADRATSVIVYDGSGTTNAQTIVTYDGSSLTSTSGAPNHDYTNFSSSNPFRGNSTTISRWLNTTNTWLNTTNTYNDLGDLLSTTDPLNNTTSFSYADNFTDGVNRNALAFVTQTTYPATSGVVHVERKQYHWNTSLLATSCGQNFSAASACTNAVQLPQPDYARFAYDFMNRPLSKTNGDGGQTTLTYNDTSLPLTSSSTESITASLPLSRTTVLDGMGRILQTQLTSDPGGADYVDFTYDTFGRRATVSNPYRSKTESTYGVTTHFYDALGRITTVIPPDGSSTSNNVSTTYSGNCATVTDQAGKKRKSCADALGRLIQVFEPDAAGNFIYETDYQYDALNNLTRVDQKGNDLNSANWRTRTFTYNSLSQLLTATNPESGTISYIYDNDGNLLTKTAPAPNQTGSATVTTSFSYDALHRLTQKSFSDTTPAVNYGYDAVAPTGCAPPALAVTNGIGRRTSMCDAAGTEAWSYDAMGRPLADSRATNGVTKTTSYAYNLDGSLASLTYPSGRAITYTPSAAGRMLSAVDSANAINYATGAIYAPQGALASFANGASLVSTFYYNSRLQPCRVSVKSSGAAPASCTDAANIGGILDLTYGFNAGTSNNGNVAAIANNRNTGRSQSFSYDELNRVKTAQTSSTTGSNCWGESFGYDVWGNLLTIGAVSGYSGCTQENLSLSATTKNQISGDSYDAAGNLLSGPGMGPFTYDAENRLLTAGGVTYAYDGDGKRVKKSNGKLYWYGMGSDPLTETDLAGTPSAEFIFFNGKRTARLDLPSAAVHYYFSDHLGSANVVTTDAGAIQDESDYYPFGGERPVLSSSGNTYKFTGKERDSESGLDNFGARYNSSSMGRFMTPDWSAVVVPVPFAKFSDPQSLNLYTYARNNPLNLIDPDGHKFSDFFKHVWERSVNAWKYGEMVTNAELPAAFERERKWLINNVAHNGDEANALRGASDSQINGLYQKWDAALAAATGGEQPCGASCYRRAANGSLVFYRGGGSLEAGPNDVKIGPDGLVKTTHGPSLNTDPAKLERFGEVYEIKLLPPELQIIQRGMNASHYEIVPRQPMTLERFQELLRSVVTKIVETPE